MRWLIFYLLVCLLFPFQSQATDVIAAENEKVKPEADNEAELSDEDKELIAELELMELLELLENMNALASMEDTE